MKVFELIKDGIKRMDQYRLQQILIYFLLFGFIINGTYVLIKISIINGDCSKGLFTIEESVALQNDILVFPFIYMVLSILGMILIYFWIKAEEKKGEENENECI